MISVIVPCHNEEKVLPIFIKEIKKTEKIMAEKYGECFEYIFVDDGSSDNTLSILKDSGMNYISFSRNFGKESAMYAGLKSAKGDYTVIIDADLQDPPELLPEMYRCITEEGYDSVGTRRVTRKGEPVIRSLLAGMFYKLMKKISQTDIVDGARDYRLMNKKFVNALLSMSEYNRFSKGLFGWVGFKTKWLEFENVERIAGETNWSLRKLFKYSVEGIVAFSTFPLVLSGFFGIVSCVLAFFFLGFIVIRKLLFGDPVDGWASTVSILLFLGGIQLLCLGILGQYLSKTYLETKNRPIYIVSETNIDK